MMKRSPAFFLALLLSAALAQETVPIQPGSVATLVFPGPLPEEKTPRVDPPLRLLLASESPPYLVLVEVPETTPPGVYRVCLGECREVRVGERRSLEVKLQAGGGLLFFRARNGGNVSELLPVRPAEESEVRFAPFRLELAPGEAKELEVPLRGRGLLVLEAGERRYLLRVEPEEGPPPPALLGKLALSTEEAQVDAGVKGEALSLEAALLRAWSGDYRASLKAATPQARLLLDSSGYLELGLKGGPLLEDAVLGLSQDSLSFSVLSSPSSGSGNPLTLGLRSAYAFGKGLGGLSLALAQGPWSFALGYPLFVEGRVYLPELQGGEFYARLEETGGRFRLNLPPYALEGGLVGEPFGSLEYASSGNGLSYRLKAGYQAGAFLEGALGYRTGTYGFSLGSRVGNGSSLYISGEAQLEIATLRGLLSYPFSGSPSGFLQVEGELEDVKFFLRGEYLKGFAFRAGAAFRFSLDLPELQGLLYPSFALLQGKTLPEGEVRVGSYRIFADKEGRFALRLPPGTYRVSAFPPAGVLALPVDQEVRLPPGGEVSLVLLPLRAVQVEVVCEKGAGRVRLVGERTGAEVGCGECALLPEGTYRPVVLPEKGFHLKEPFLKEISLAYGERTVLRPLFEPVPLEVAKPQVLLNLSFFALDGTPTEVATPGEVLRVRAAGAGRVVARLEEREVVAEPLGTEFILRVPFDLEGGTYLVQATAEGEEAKGEKELRVDPSRPLFRLIFTPPRPAPGERVEVRLEARTFLREARLRLPWGGESVLNPAEEGWTLVGAFVLPPSLSFGQVVTLEGVALTPDGVVLPFRAALRLRASP